MKKLFTLLALMLTLSACNKAQKEAKGVVKNQHGAQEQQFIMGEDNLAASHILITWKGLQTADSTTTRTKEQALSLAKELIGKIKKDPKSFETLAKTNSADKGSGMQGGDLGSFPPEQMIPVFTQAVQKLKDGEMAAEPVESEFGYHIIRRNSLLETVYGAEIILITYAPDGTKPNMQMPVVRTKAAAQKLVNEIKGKINGDNYTELAIKHNDADDRLDKKGAVLMPMSKNVQGLPPNIYAAVEKLKYNAVTGPIEIPNGFIFIKRKELEQIGASHILVGWKSEMMPPNVARTKAEAKALAEDLLKQVNADPKKFEDLASTKSDSPFAPKKGKMGKWFVGMLIPDFEKTTAAIEKLEVGKIGATLVEGKSWYEIVRRDAIPVAKN
jgi:parvulin-like peptidyl-prolyl isomerase